jgi:hypothetical protein
MARPQAACIIPHAEREEYIPEYIPHAEREEYIPEYTSVRTFQ